MRTIFLECYGRLANQLLCMANAMHFVRTSGLSDRTIAIEYDVLDDKRILLPGGVVVAPRIKRDIPRVSRSQIASVDGDCLWASDDVYSDHPDSTIVAEMLREIALRDDFAKEVERAGGKDCVGIHVRYGDYGKTDGPFVRAPNSYYVGSVGSFKSAGFSRFFLATDGEPHEVEYLTDVRGVTLGMRADPLFDLFTLSKCAVIIGSSSTFSSVACMYGGIQMTTPSMDMAEIRRFADACVF